MSRATIVAGLLIALGALLLYVSSNPGHFNVYNHFVWQADAWLHGRAWFPYPTRHVPGLPDNWYLQDVYPVPGTGVGTAGRVLLPFPPLPAVILLPLVAISGLAADQEAVAIAAAALGVWLAWWMLEPLPVGSGVRALTVVVFATGTVWWWAAAVGSTWYFAHLVAADVTLVAVGVSLRADRRAVEPRPALPVPGDGQSSAVPPDGDGIPAPERGWVARAWAATWPLDRRQVLAGFLLGLAATARLPLVLGAPFLVAVGGGGGPGRRLASAAVGGVVPVAALLAYTWLTSGALVHPGYDYQYQLEAHGYPSLGYHPAWSVEDPRYIPQNLRILLGALPVVAPEVAPDTLKVRPVTVLCVTHGATRTLFDRSCPLAMPIDIGTSLPLSAPGLLLVIPAIWRRARTRLVLGSVSAALAIVTFNLAHFSQGWVQWGYRFSLDFIPFLLPLVALGAVGGNGRPRRVAIVLLVVGAAVNLWGVTWGQILGW